jgi:hypothetical protein
MRHLPSSNQARIARSNACEKVQVRCACFDSSPSWQTPEIALHPMNKAMNNMKMLKQLITGVLLNFFFIDINLALWYGK